MKTLKDIDISGKNIIIRCDYNVPMEGNVIKDNSKIVKSIKMVHPDDLLTIKVNDGIINTKVIDVKEEKSGN